MNPDLLAAQEYQLNIRLRDDFTLPLTSSLSRIIDVAALLVIYGDGVSKAQDASQAEFGEERLLQVVGSSGNGRFAAAIQDAVTDAAHQFAGNSPQFDDITLMIVQRGNHA